MLFDGYKVCLEEREQEKAEAASKRLSDNANSAPVQPKVCKNCGAVVPSDDDGDEKVGEVRLPRLSWQQACRLLYHMWRDHQAIERIIIIPSRDIDGGVDRGQGVAREFKRFLRLFLRRIGCGAKVEKLPGAVNYEDLEEVEAAIDEALEIAKKDGFSDRDICVDATAGQKTFSIAASNATLRSEIIFAYVPTTKPEAIEDLASVVNHYRPMYFDLVPITNDAT